MSQSRAWRRDWPLMLALLILAIITYIPFVFTVINSFKINAQFFQQFWLPTLPLHPENYLRAWPAMGKAILNSFTYSIPTLVLTLVISGLAGYAFARYRFPGRNLLFIAILALIMIPGILLVIPMFSVIIALDWDDTLQGVVLPWVSVEIVFGTFLMRTFLRRCRKNTSRRRGWTAPTSSRCSFALPCPWQYRLSVRWQYWIYSSLGTISSGRWSPSLIAIACRFPSACWLSAVNTARITALPSPAM